MKLLRWMFESNVIVDHLVPFSAYHVLLSFCTNFSERRGATSLRCNYRRLPGISISNEDSNVARAVYRYCLTAQHLSTFP